MPTIEEAADAFAKDLTATPPNIAGLMMAFTPEGMMKAMAMQTQMQARAAAALAAGRTAAPSTGYTLDVKPAEGDDQVVHLNMQSADGTLEVMTRWRDVAGVWKVNDLGVVRMVDVEGNPVDLSAPAAPPATPPSA